MPAPQFFVWLGGAAVLFILPLVYRNAYHLDVLTTAFLFAILALGLNLIVGLAGLLHLGYAAFYAVGAYTYGLLNIHAGWPFWLAVLPAMGIAALCGALLGIPVLRVRGDYLAIVTLGFGEIVRIALTNLDQWTGGPNGLLGIDHPRVILPGGVYDFGVASMPYYYLTLVCLLGGAVVATRISHSRLGRAWIAIRNDELAAACMGVPVGNLKLWVQALGAAFAGLAGAVFAAKQGTITPDSFDFILSVMVLAMVVLGGLGSVRGALLGACVLSSLPEVLRGFEQYRMLVFGLVMVLVMRLRPQGMVGLSLLRVQRLRRYASST
jgi:branched-chain amino acid transport system permease protein